MKRHRIAWATFVVGLALTTFGALAQEPVKKPHVPLEKTIGQVTPTGPVPSLAVINSQGATLADGKLTLTGVSKNSIVFADRPVRAAGHVTTEQFLMQWDEGKDNFAIDPPNATISVLGGDGSDVSDAVVTLKTPKLEGTTLTFDVAVLEGSLTGATGPAALFIDHFAGGFGGGFHGGGFHGGYAHRRRCHFCPCRRISWRCLLARSSLSWRLVRWRGRCRGSGCWSGDRRRCCLGLQSLLSASCLRLLPVSALLLGELVDRNRPGVCLSHTHRGSRCVDL